MSTYLGAYRVANGYNDGFQIIHAVFDPESQHILFVHPCGYFTEPYCHTCYVDHLEAAWYIANHPTLKRNMRIAV